MDLPLLSTTWASAAVKSPNLDHKVPVVAAKDIPYLSDANRLQNISIYLPSTPENLKLIDRPVVSIPGVSSEPSCQVHVHGGAWRDPQLLSSSIEASVAHTFSDPSSTLKAIISVNYTLSPFPKHPKLPYTTSSTYPPDPAREALHPTHVRDVLHALDLIGRLGLVNGSYILSGHSAGACLIFQSILQPPRYWGLDIRDPPCPAALLGMNGLYDLPNLVNGLGESHAHLKDVYADLQSIAFGADEAVWENASPARFKAEIVEQRIAAGLVPSLIMLDQSSDDQLVPMNQTEGLERMLHQVKGLEIVRGKRCTGRHAAPWEEGYMIWDNIQDVMKLLKQGSQKVLN